MQGYGKGSVGQFILDDYNDYVEARLDGYCKCVLGPSYRSIIKA
jgi:hypothetical protein